MHQWGDEWTVQDATLGRYADLMLMFVYVALKPC
jgi:hypothetical protein